ncbi:MAG: PDZ domain-containing protein [Phaeodactylibacter sp.]|nr:PDZ domain-containing protein [Phaeodactylibacter sp.]
MKKILTLALLLLGSTLAWSQAPEQPAATTGKKQIVILKKTVDENGNEVVEKIVKELDDEENVFFIEKEGLHEQEINVDVQTEGDQVKVWVTEGQGEGGEEEIHVIRMQDGDDPDFHFEWKGDMDEEALKMLEEKGIQLHVDAAAGEPSNKAFLGVHIGTRKTVEVIDGETIETMEGESDAGVKIMEVVEGSAAEAAGLQDEDVITAIDGKVVSRASDLTGQLSNYAPGDVVTLSYLRAGVAATTTATLGARPAHKIVTVDVKGEPHAKHDFIIDIDDKDAPYVVEFDFDGEGNYFYTWSEDEAGVPFGEERNNLQLEELSVYPNPTDGELNLQFKGAAVPTEITLVDRSGKVILKEVLKNFDGQYSRMMNLKDVAADQLFLVIRQGDEIVSRMVVLQK